MKNKLFLIAVVLLSLVGYSANAQIKVGGSLAYATEINGPGITVNGLYQINDQWEVAPSFTYFFKKDYVSWWSIDANAHYVFKNDDKIALYGLAGLELLGVKVDVPSYSFGGYTVGGGSASDSKFGLNIGAGGRLGFTDKICGFGEVKYSIVDNGYLCFNVGVLFSLK